MRRGMHIFPSEQNALSSLFRNNFMDFSLFFFLLFYAKWWNYSQQSQFFWQHDLACTTRLPVLKQFTSLWLWMQVKVLPLNNGINGACNHYTPRTWPNLNILCTKSICSKLTSSLLLSANKSQTISYEITWLLQQINRLHWMGSVFLINLASNLELSIWMFQKSVNNAISYA